MAKDYERQQEYIAETQDFIRRNLAGQKTKQAKSRRKMLDKLDELERPETDETLAKFNLDGGARSGAIALTADRLTRRLSGQDGGRRTSRCRSGAASATRSWGRTAPASRRC